MPNCFSFVLSVITGTPEQEWATRKDFAKLGMVECPPTEATIVAKSDSIGVYHVAVVEERNDDGTPKTVKHRWGGEKPVVVNTMDQIKPHSLERRVVFFRRKES